MPSAPVNLNTPNLNLSWSAGGSLVLKWGYRYHGSLTAGAGDQISGFKVKKDPSPLGTFFLELATTGGDVKRIVEQTKTSYTYSNANMVADFAGEPSEIKVTLYQKYAGNTSVAHTKIMTRN